MTALDYQRPFSLHRVPDVAALYDPANIGGQLLLRDTFVGSAETPLVGRKADTGQLWQISAGATANTFVLDGTGKVHMHGSGVAYVDVGTPDVDYTCRVVAGALQSVGIVFRFKDTNNYAYCRMSNQPSGQIISNGVATNMPWCDSTAALIAAGLWSFAIGANEHGSIRVQAQGEVITLTFSNSTESRSVTFNMTEGLDGTGIGIWSATNPAFTDEWWYDVEAQTVAPQDGDSIGVLPDLSGHGRHLVQPDPAKRPMFLATALGRNWLPRGDHADGLGVGNWAMIRGTAFDQDATTLHNDHPTLHMFSGISSHQADILWGGGGTDFTVPPGDYLLRFSAKAGAASALVVSGRGTGLVGDTTVSLTTDWQDFQVPYTVASVIDVQISAFVDDVWLSDISLRPATPPPLPNGQPVLDFDGVDDYLTTAGWDTHEALSIAAVTCHNGPSRGFRQWLARMDQALESSWIVTLNGTEEYFDVRSHVAYTTYARGAWHTKTFIAGGSAGHGWVDGVVAAPDSLSGPGTYANAGAVTPASYPLWVGVTPFSGPEAMSLGLLVLADRQLSDAERTFLQAGLKARFGTP